MKLIGPAGTELRHILPIYIMCYCDIDRWPTFPKNWVTWPRVLVECTRLFENL